MPRILEPVTVVKTPEVDITEYAGNGSSGQVRSSWLTSHARASFILGTFQIRRGFLPSIERMAFFNFTFSLFLPPNPPVPIPNLVLPSPFSVPHALKSPTGVYLHRQRQG